jgi:DNA-binding response OmpR family regulator
MRIVIANHVGITAKLLRFVLTEAGHEAVLALSADEALRAIIGRETDGVLLDVDLPDVSGYDLCTELRAKQYLGPVLFVSQRRDVRAKLRAFNHGADDYVTEPFDPQELVARIEVVARRYKQQDRQSLGMILKAGAAELRIRELVFQIAGRPRVLLTPTEMRILECLMRNVGRTVGRERLIERTWGYDDLGERNRVDVYVARLRKKIERNPSQPEYLLTVRDHGYVFRVPADLTDVPSSVSSSI